MNQEKSSSSGNKALGMVFFCWALSGLIVGWLVFPNLIYSQKAQPINFSHVAHQGEDCESCHSLRADGTYSGIPRLDRCRECHESAQGSSEAEAKLISDYVEKNRELPWRVYAWQPDNVYFSDAPHKGQGLECTRCHRDVQRRRSSLLTERTGFPDTAYPL